MTNRIAAILALIITAVIALDIFLNEGKSVLFVMKKLWDLIEYMAFWR